MGHYRSEMVCGSCDSSPCSCARPVWPDDGHMWIVENHRPVRVSEFDARHSSMPTQWGSVRTNPFLARMGRTLHKTEAAAQAEADTLLDEAIASAELRLAELRARRGA